MKRIDEAMAHMRSKPWLCGPSKVAMRHDQLTIASLAPSWTDAYEKKIRRAVFSVLNERKEGLLLLADTRSRSMPDAAKTLSHAGKRIQRAVFDHQGALDDQLLLWLKERWAGIEYDPDQRVDVPIPDPTPNDPERRDALLFTGVSPAYPKWHPRHFPMDALAATRMSTINAISAKLSAQIYDAAGKRAGGEYATGHFLVDPYEHVGSASAE